MSDSGRDSKSGGSHGGLVVVTDSFTDDDSGTSSEVGHSLNFGRSAVNYGDFPPCFHSPRAMISWVFHTIKALVLTLLSLGQKLMCCRSRKKSGAGGAGFRGSGLPTSISSTNQSPNDLESWDWDDNPSEIVIESRKPETVQDHIEAYRSSLQEAKRQASLSKDEEQARAEAAEAEAEANLFADMTPTVIAPKKLFVGSKSASGSTSSRGGRKMSNRLGVRDDLTDPILAMGDELDDWGSGAGSNAGWQAEDDDISEVLKETKKQNRKSES